MSGRRRTRAAGILILCGAVLLEPTGACLAEAVTMRDLADVLPAASAFARKTRPFPYLVGYATDGGRAVGVVFLTTEVVPEQCWGYRDQIATLVGVDSAGQITGIKVLSESENARYTKGLLADGSWFLAQFTGKDAGDRFVLYSDVEGITGATITSSTLTRSVKAGLELITDQILRRHVDGAHPAARFPSQELLWQADCVFLWLSLARPCGRSSK